MTDQPENNDRPGESAGRAGSGEGSRTPEGRVPRLAIGVVIAGLVASAMIYGLSFIPGSGSLEVEWDTIEEIEAPGPTQLGAGRFEIARTTLSALAPNEEGELIYRVAGVARVDSGGNRPTTVRCDIFSRSDEDTQIARSSRLRAAWPKPSENLQAQDVPETSFVRFSTGETGKVDLPIRDVARRYTDSTTETLVDWPDYHEEFHTWIWTMEEGTGISAATLPWVVIFEAERRPRGKIVCNADIGREKARVDASFLQEEWPIVDDQPNPEQEDTGDVSNVE